MSLRRIALRDFVIVHQLELDLHTGFTALTGETGAGKSILIDALQLVMGARADAGVVREGCPRTDLSAEFDLCPAAAALLAQWGLEDDAGADTAADTNADQTVLLRRSIDASGKSRGWINGTPATASQLRDIGAVLVDIHGQHAWQSLMQAASIRRLLDAYGQVDTRQLEQLWHTWQQAQDRLHAALDGQQAQQQEQERLQWQLAEVDKIAPQPDEWDALNAEHQRLSSAQQLLEAAASASALLQSDDGGAVRLVYQAVQALEAHSAIEPAFADSLALLQSCHAQLYEAQRDLHNYASHIEQDPAALARLDERLSQWLALARRFRIAPQELAATAQSWRTRLQQLEQDVDIDALQHACTRAQSAWQAEADHISSQRQRAAQQLSADISSAMQELGMAGGRFVAQVQRATQPASHGQDAVDFLVAGHAGATPRPLGKVASGGELSRLSLAIAVTTSKLGQAATLVFDEVDSGIGGAVAQDVGRLMRQLGHDRQVLAVTHLPQVAASAHQHIRIHKQHDANGHTSSSAQLLDATQRQGEIARMLGGDITSTSLAHAQELLQHAQAGAGQVAVAGEGTSPGSAPRPLRGRGRKWVDKTSTNIIGCPDGRKLTDANDE